MAYVLSHSKLKILEECPKCFWLSVVKNVTRPSIPSATILIKLDNIIKKYFDEHRNEGKLPPIIDEVIDCRLAKNIPTTLYSKEDENIVLMGILDECLEFNDGTIAVLDHKTSSMPPKRVHPVYKLQLDIYMYLLERNGYKTANKAFLAYYYPNYSELHNGLKIKCKIMEIIPDKLKVIEVLGRAKEVLNGPMPNSGKDCKFCRWAYMSI
ncbi:PD-(D/E)XK nuclease family protein [Candidatus Micrarchaeota archaeon]|nr:PD-(D/E)XK nuclease family protein [Candidatus Micrarchaeota archaeon]